MSEASHRRIVVVGGQAEQRAQALRQGKVGAGSGRRRQRTPERGGWLGRLARLALAPVASTRSELPALRALIARYRRAGCDVVVVDRESGRVLGDAHLAVRDATAESEAA